MSEYANDESSPSRHDSDANIQNSLDDSANNSIMGKVKSRVSSILPNRLSKWFSPSAKLQNDSLNGSMCRGNSTLRSRRRRRIEIEEEENYEDEDVQNCEEYDKRNHHIYSKQGQNRDCDADDDDDNDDDDDSQNSEEEYNVNSTKQNRRELNVERQPPAKRSRLNVEARDSPICIRHQPLLSSTPAVSSAYLRNSPTTTSASRNTYQRLSHLNLYGSQNKKEPAFNFVQQKEIKSIAKTNTDIIDLITNSSYDHESKFTDASNVCGGIRTGISSRKSLNIPSATTVLTGTERVYGTVGHLKRQPLSTAKADLSETNAVSVPPRRTSTTLQEVEDQVVGDNEQKRYDSIEKRDGLLSDPNANTYNGSTEISNNFVPNKRQKLINGTGSNALIIPESNEGIFEDSASESGESAIDVTKTNASNTQQRKTGLFNMSTAGTANTRNSSRTSSFGNGLNFYSHLEGPKSLFSGPHHCSSNPLNNSSLSLTSLNRRQFNASIYGSTSALSDSRLLNTFSPFYKGKTTYGGAAAYNKYTAGAGASAVRITPTLIRPISSLSTLSSSSNSLANNINSQVGENSIISSTAKRILDLINDFATPLSEAKKMASNLKTNPNLQIPLQAKGRLNESDLNASRAVRLSQVRTPYSRPAVILQPSGNAGGRGTACGPLPPVKELQVPTMSQLLQMKKMQNTTENARKIAQSSTAISEYTLPDMASSKTNPHSIFEQDQQKHTNKIRTKMTNSIRPSASSKDLQDEEPPPTVNLPNIAFPIMNSVPKIDIQLNNLSATCKNNPECKSSKLSPAKEVSDDAKMDSSKSAILAFNPSPINLTQTSVSNRDNEKVQLPLLESTSLLKSANNFTFSEPLKVVGVLPPTQIVTKIEIDKYKFSPPLEVIVPPSSNCLKSNNTQSEPPQLKKGSCLDALSKPLALPQSLSKPKATEQTCSNNASMNLCGFGNQFKKLSNEWECDACMIRNKHDINKCLACEQPRKQSSSTLQPILSSGVSANVKSSFGQQFKKSSNDWECDTCLIRNKEEAKKCIACETQRKCGVPQSTTDLPPIQNTFGDAFKQKSGTWECQTCLISNKNEVNKCIACETKKPGCANITSSVLSKSAVPSTQFKFGFNAVDNTNCNADAGFKTLAAQQKVSKWECDACMTQNEANRTKCACCEQPKPGTSAELTNPASNKFQFGATAASKFCFGFGNGANAPKEDDLRKDMSSKSEESVKPPPTTLVLGTSKIPPEKGEFQFALNVKTSNTSECKKDETDGNKQITGFKIGVAAPTDESKIKETSAVVAPPSGFKFVSRTDTTIATVTTASPTLSSAAAVNTPSVKFCLPSTSNNTNISSNNDQPKCVGLPAFGFGTNTASSTTGGFSFGNKIMTKSAAAVVQENTTSDNASFKAPATTTDTKSSGFVFGSSAVKNSLTATPASFVSSTFNTTASTAATTSTTTAAVKPMFSFGTNTLTTPALNSQATPAFSNFSFGSHVTNNAAATTTSNKILAAVSSTSTITATANTTTKTSSMLTMSATTTTPASTNIFGSFVGGTSSSNALSPPIFGSSVNPPANNNNLSTVSSSTNNPTPSKASQFGAFGSKTTSNVFGSFGGVGGIEAKNNALVKPNGTKPTLPVFGNVAPSSTSQSNLSGFVFGSNAAIDTTAVTAVSTAGSVTSTSTTWPKNSFVFGSTAAAASSTNTAATVNASENKEVAKHSVFGSFGTCSGNSNIQQQTSSIFGGPTSNNGSPLSTSGPTNSSTNLFGTNSAPAATSIFGANSSGNAATPAPAFGSSPFGGVASSTNATPTFGSTAASGTTFGSFGGSTSNTTTTTTEVKKPEAAFNFGAASTTQSTSGGFNFGSSASTTKPAFNFGGTSNTQQPTFNFTGTTESQSSTKPFQFGATPSAPVFNFNRGVLEGTPNAPFQFNAGAAPVSSNIFAPAPTPGAQTAQQAKRKIRAPIRRVTQR